MSNVALCIGPPGTGKTRLIKQSAENAARKLGAERIMICSFTRAAATEVAHRLRDVIPAENVGTLHSFAIRALDGVERIADSPKFLPVWNEWIECQRPEWVLTVKGRDADEGTFDRATGETQGDQLWEAIGIARAKLQPEDEWTADMRGFWELWSLWKGEYDALDYQDIISLAAETPHAPGIWRDGDLVLPSVILCDESQDFTALEMRLLRQWASHESCQWFYLAGDPLQSLFEWAGAGATDFLIHDEVRMRKILDQSFRVPTQPRDYAFRWIQPLKERVEAVWGQPITYRPRCEEIGLDDRGEIVYGKPVDGAVRRLPEANWRWPDEAVDDAEARLSETVYVMSMEEGQLVERPKTVMFQASCSHMLEPLISVLKKRGIPFHNPWRRKQGLWNPLARRKGAVHVSDRILAFLRGSYEAWGDDCGMWSTRDLWLWVEWCEAKDLLRRGAKKAIEEAAAVERPVSSEDLERWFEGTTAMDAIEASTENRVQWLLARLLKPKQNTAAYPCRIVQAAGPQALRERPRCVVGTIHANKGSEADCVYVMPDLSNAAYEQWVEGGSGKDEILRQFYVAFTRPREELVLLGAAGCAVEWL